MPIETCSPPEGYVEDDSDCDDAAGTKTTYYVRTPDTPFGQTTNGLAGQQGTARLFTWAWTSHANQKGFSFGSGVNGGSNSATNC